MFVYSNLLMFSSYRFYSYYLHLQCYHSFHTTINTFQSGMRKMCTVDVKLPNNESIKKAIHYNQYISQPASYKQDKESLIKVCTDLFQWLAWYHMRSHSVYILYMYDVIHHISWCVYKSHTFIHTVHFIQYTEYIYI